MFVKLLGWAVILNCAFGQDNLVKFVLIHETGQEQFVQTFEESLKTNNIANKFDLATLQLEEDGNAFQQLCSAFSKGGSIILDISWSGYDVVRAIAKEINVPYVKIDVSISPYLRLLDKYLDARNSTDVALVFENPEYVDQALYYWIDTTRLRMVITEKLDAISAKRLRDMRPSPNNFALLASSANMMDLYKQVSSESLLKLTERWNLLFLDFENQVLYRENIAANVNLIYPDKNMCCSLAPSSDCKCSTTNDLINYFVDSTLKTIMNVLDKMQSASQNIGATIECNTTKYDEAVQDYFYKTLADSIALLDSLLYENDIVTIRANGKMEIVNKMGQGQIVAQYMEGNAIDIIMPDIVKPVKPFYRIGTTYSRPWSYTEIDPLTGAQYWTGYCLDFAHKLSELMNFDYEIVIPEEGTFGKKDRYGNWDGVIGDLATGRTDLAITALTMTADREEVVDFVAPYFEQVGISIVMRKPIRRTSLFKFMTVLKLEVWMSIVGALVVTGFMVWLLDKYSPYSARNNKKAYPYPCRHFNLKESFWFALTSFTPQGGGEAPKALSGRTLVAAYWLFVVLMLATFTANLAAFLTVERMQTPVQSLEQLARQSRINYTVVESSETHKYFINMKHAEDTLYRMWKELTLNASTDETIYRVWDYPIREQYGQILIAINDSMPLPTAAAGFQKVEEHVDADFAFIHDSSEIKYELSRSCNFTEVGEVFGEKPYAVAVQQGSHIQDTISIRILDLQNDRFFESLQAKYWNNSAKGDCDNADDNEGITLESLGGVFIATLFGLALAMITLAGEVIYYKRKQKVEDLQAKGKPKHLVDKLELNKFAKPGGKGTITIGEAFKPVTDKDTLRMSHIALYPRNRNKLPMID